ncbi:MAG TPA: hypothetical protein VFY17_10870, partial [Pilimelia sp.]|nr:hypothetical protein [Pilimelia sp.]
MSGGAAPPGGDAGTADHPPAPADRGVSPVRRLLRRLAAAPDELEAAELRRDSVAAGCIPAGQCRRGQLVSVSGRLRAVVYPPRGTVPNLEADLYDGSDVVTLVWLGRRAIAGIEPGRALT